MKKQSDLNMDINQFLAILEDKSELLYEAAKKNSEQIEDERWVPNKEWFKED